METKFGIFAGLASVMFIGVFTAMQALGVISPSGVQGAYLSIDENGQGVSFQQSSMVTNVMVLNTPKEPGAVARYTIKFVTGQALMAGVDKITLDIDSSVGVPLSIAASHVLISASAVTGGGQSNQSVALSVDPSWEHGFEGRDIYTITVPDMDVRESSGIENIDAGAMVTVTFLISAGLTNPTESGSDDFTVSTSKEPAGVKAAFMTPLALSIDDKSDHRNTPITLVGKGFKNGTTAVIYLDKGGPNDPNMPDGMRTPGIDVDLFRHVVESNDTFTATFIVTVPPFAAEGANHINVIDGENPPNHYNGMMDGQTPVTFTIEPLLSVSTSLVVVGEEVEISLVDWPATDQVKDYITADAQGVDRVMQSAVTIAGIPQQITSGEGPVGPGNKHTIQVLIGTTVPAGVQQLKVKTYTSGQAESDVPGGASDTKNIVIKDTFSPGDAPPDPDSVAGDGAALVALFNATDGAHWTNTTNWLTNTPLGQWFGVSVRGLPRRVSGLYLARNRLSGTIPTELRNLTTLTRLDLIGNRLSGTIPAELGSLSNLWYLNFSENWFSGTIPAELGSLSNLRDLHLYDNRLSGEIPAELGSLTNLEYLDLTRNQLTGPVPSDLGRLTNLDVLLLGNNQLSGTIPTQLGSLSNLTRLSLWSNRLSGEIPAALGSLTNLEYLYLHGNRLTGEIPAELGNLASLVHMVLRDNELSGEIPAELGNLSNLTHLYLFNNQLSGETPAELGNLSNLTHLYLFNNQLSGETPAELGSLANLTELFLNKNRLSGEIPEELGSLSNLEWLRLDDNQLTGEIPEELGSLSNLKELYLNNNQLTGEIPAGLGSLAGLEELFLGGNGLTGCIPNGLRGIETNDLSQLGLPFCDMPGAPTIATPIVPGDAALTVAWAAPINTGSSAITAYDLRYIETGAADKSDANWTVVEDVWAAGSGSLQYTLSGLTGGTQYDVRVRAVNAAGASAWSAALTGTTASAVTDGDPLIVRYDANGNGMIEKNEVIAAINDYLFGEGDEAISKAEVIRLINLYLFG